MGNYFIAVALILLLMLGWVTVQSLGRLFARRHPEWGPTQEGLGCGSSCSCGSTKSCGRK